MVGTLVVVRHGQASLFAADYDELSALGVTQSERLGAHWRERGPHPDVVFTGPARRQRDTARLCGVAYADADHGWPAPQVLPELDEHDAFGMLRKVVPELAKDPEVGALAQQANDASDHGRRAAAFQRLFEVVMGRWIRGEVDDGDVESWPVFAARVERGLDRIVAHDGPGATIVAFTSVGPIAVMLRRALGLDDSAAFRTAWRVRNASVVRFVFQGRRFTLDGMNVLPHLPDPSDWTFR